MPHRVTDPKLRARLVRIQERLESGLGVVDPHRRLRGRPVSYQVIAGQTFEIVYREVTRIDEAEIRGVQRLIGENCSFSVSPHSPETLAVRFVVPLTDHAPTDPHRPVG